LLIISTVLTALDGGCQRRPQPGTLLTFTGSLFSQQPINVTAPANDTSPAGPLDQSTTSLNTGTIVGIAVGAGLLLLGGTALFIVHCRKQRKQRKQQEEQDENEQQDVYRTSHNLAATPPWVTNDHKKSGSFSSYEMKTQRSYSNADYYDDVEDDMRSKHYNYNPHRPEHGPNSALPTHRAYIPRAMGRVSPPNPSPTPPAAPAATYQQNRPAQLSLQSMPKKADSGYVRVTTDPEKSIATAPPPPPPQLAPNTRVPASYVPPPPPPPPGSESKSKSKIPSLSLPSVPRIRVPKKYNPPKIVVEGATPVDENRDLRKMKITPPLAFREHDERFKDQTLQGGPVMATKAPNVDYSQVGDIPIVSGKSDLYGY
jgi:hypothetical protein